MGSPLKNTVEFNYYAPSPSTLVETDLKSDKEFDEEEEEYEDKSIVHVEETTKNDDGDAYDVASLLSRMHVCESSRKTASTQEAARKDEVAMIELIKQANQSRPQDEVIIGGWLYNKRKRQKPLHLFAEKTWSGDLFNKYPNDIEESGSFVQTANKKNGIKSAVVYSLKESDDLPFTHFGYLLAWSDSIKDGNNIRKTYGYCRLLETFNDIEWDNVEKNLDEASSSFSYIDKAFTKTSIKAQIVDNVIYAEFDFDQ